MWTISSIKASAMEKFKANYGSSVLVLVLAGIIIFAAESLGSVIPLGGSLAATIFLVNIIGDVGTRRFFIHNHRDKGEVGHLFESFSSSYLNQVLVMLLKNLFVWLWSLLLIVPGIIKYYEYLMVPYILTDNPEISWDDAKEQSRAMMEGEKMNAFLLHLSFIGWFLLGIITLGILHIVFTGPYMAQAEAELYHVLLEKTGYAAAGSQSGPFDHYGQTYAGGYQAVNTNAPYAGGFSTQDVGYVPQAMQPAAPAPRILSRPLPVRPPRILLLPAPVRPSRILSPPAPVRPPRILLPPFRNCRRRILLPPARLPAATAGQRILSRPISPLPSVI